MRDIFYTIVVVWLVYRIWHAFSAPASKNASPQKEGDVTIQNHSSNPKNNEKGEYVDYEEIKD